MSSQPDLVRNAITFLQGRYPQATVINNETFFTDHATENVIFVAWPMIVQDPNSRVKQRAIAVSGIKDRDHLEVLANRAIAILEPLDSDVLVGFCNVDPKRHKIDTTQMAFAPRLIIYMDEVRLPYQVVMEVFASVGLLVDIVDESEMFSTLFISFGGPDQYSATSINTYLRGKGIKTWFFPDDALPGQKLHRMMHDGINSHDRVLLICSKASLTRPGVLNEIERVLEREAKEGGSEILIPVTLDDYVYQDWAPTRRDVADQVRSRVITKIDLQPSFGNGFNMQLEKLIKALARKNG